MLSVLPRKENDDCTDEHRDAERDDWDDKLMYFDGVVDHTQNGRKHKNTDWIKGPLMTNVSSATRGFSSCNDERDVQEHVNDYREDFSDDSESDVEVVGDWLIVV